MIDVGFNLLLKLMHDQLPATLPFENLLAIRVDPLALMVHYLVVLKQILSSFKVSFFDFLLSP